MFGDKVTKQFEIIITRHYHFAKFIAIKGRCYGKILLPLPIMRRIILYIFLLLIPLELYAESSLPKKVHGKIATVLTDFLRREVSGGRVTIVESRIGEGDAPRVEIYASAELGYYPYREDDIATLYDEVREVLPEKYAEYELSLFADGKPIESLVMGCNGGVDDHFTYDNVTPLITRLSSLSQPTNGLANRHIALWQSHGRIWQQKAGAWCWQRPKLWLTVEDMFTQSFVIPYLVPMLERAGANVLLPRERSMRCEELIIDNDAGIDATIYREHSRKHEWQQGGRGFAHLQRYYASRHNPFEDGTTRIVEACDKPSRVSTASWGGEIPTPGIYSVYVSYSTHPRSITDAHYTVHASGGDRELCVNQRMGGGMWVCLGDFYFEAGYHEKLVSIDNFSKYTGVVTADAVKIGGGMGNIYRGDECETSDMPRFAEGSRYWLQWSGFSTDVYEGKGGSDDYTEDYMSRPHWVNDLMGGTQHNPDTLGRNIPIDLAFALHSDAGRRDNDDVIGTLGIYCTRDDEGLFVGGASRLLSRELTDAVMTSVVTDIRAMYEPRWMRRGMWDRAYYEARIPKCPTLLLEVMSHQNFAEMRLGLDPAFRFDVSRAIYKGMLKHIAAQYDMEYVVQPLPVKRFSAHIIDRSVKLSWQPAEDIFEPTATADYYILYTRVGDGGFDAGRRVEGTSLYVEQRLGEVYSYKITAVNRGGESFDSEVISACVQRREKGRVMIINGFDRVSAPISRREEEAVGFYLDEDSGVGYIEDIAFIGEQHDYDPLSENLGLSNDNYAANVIAGNSFDYAALHGASIAAAGFSYASASRAAVEAGDVDMSRYDVVDIIMGKQRTTPIGRAEKGYRHEAFTDAMRIAIGDYLRRGGKVIISGCSAIGDMWHSPLATDEDRAWSEQVLGIKHGGTNKPEFGTIRAYAAGLARRGFEVNISTMMGAESYAIEQCDIINPASADAMTIMTYEDSERSAAVATPNGIILGFPIESILVDEERDMFLRTMLKYLTH